MRKIVTSAYHEAGHAVVAHLVGRKIVSVSIVKNGNSVGRMFSVADEANLKTDARSVRIVTSLAGPMAEWMYWSRREVNRKCGDYEDVSEELDGLPLDAFKDMMSKAETIAVNALYRNWRSVECLAETLLKDEVVEGKRAHEIITRKQPMPRQLELPLESTLSGPPDATQMMPADFARCMTMPRDFANMAEKLGEALDRLEAAMIAWL